MTRVPIVTSFTVILVVLLLRSGTVMMTRSRNGGMFNWGGSRTRRNSVSSANSKNKTANNRGYTNNDRINNRPNAISRALSNQEGYHQFTDAAMVGYMVGSSRKRYYHHANDRNETDFDELPCNATVDRSTLRTAENVTDMGMATTWEPQSASVATVIVYWKCADNEVCTSNDCQRKERRNEPYDRLFFYLPIILGVLACCCISPCVCCCIVCKCTGVSTDDQVPNLIVIHVNGEPPPVYEPEPPNVVAEVVSGVVGKVIDGMVGFITPSA